MLNYAGSSALAQQIVNGAPVDILAAANTATMDTLSKVGLVVGEPSVFVTNKLEIAVAPGNPLGAEPGVPLWFAVKATEVGIHPAAG